MTQQIALLRQLWQNQPPQGYRFRATIKADPYSKDEGRAMWILLNPTMVQTRTVLASHLWATQDQSGAYPPPIGATISFDANVRPYMRTNGISGFGLVNLHNLVIEDEAGAYVAGADYVITRDEINDEFALEATELLAQIAAGDALPPDFDLADMASGRLEQNIVAQAQQRTEKLTQRIQFNDRLAALAMQLEQVTAQFLQAWQQAQATAADLLLLEAEIAADPALEEERHALQQLATRQRDLAAAYWRWQPLSPAEAAPSLTSPPAALPDEATPPELSSAAPPVVEEPIAEPEEPPFDIFQAIADELAARQPNAPAITPPSTQRKANKRKSALPATPASPVAAPQPDPVTLTQSEAIAALHPASAIETEEAEQPPAVKTDEVELEQPSASPPPIASRSAVPKRAKDLQAWHTQMVEQVWKLVQRKQPLRGHHAAYTLSEIKDGRTRDTDHLKMIGLKAIIELLTLLDERPTRKELGNRYLGYDLPVEWSPIKLSQKRLPLEDERVRGEIVKEIRETMLAGS